MAGDLARIQRAYARGRLERAFVGALPVSLVVAGALSFGTRGEVALPLGALLLVLTAVALFRGGNLGRAVLPGIAAGIFPLLLALGARASGHVCLGSSCMSLCVPACSFGGVVAGGALAWVGLRAKLALPFFAAAFGFTLLTGSLGCSCVGGSGVIGLFAGLFVSFVPTLRLSTSKRA